MQGDTMQTTARIQDKIGCLNIWGLDTVEIEVIHLRTDAQMQGMLCLEDSTNKMGYLF